MAFAGFRTCDPLCGASPSGRFSLPMLLSNAWTAPDGRLFTATDRGFEVRAFRREAHRRVEAPLNAVPALTTDSAYVNVKCIDVSADGRMVALGLRATPFLAVYDTATWKAFAQPATLPQGTVGSVAFSPDGSRLAVTHANSPYVTIYNTGDWSKISNPGTLPAGAGGGVAFSPDGSKLAVGHANAPYMLVYNVSDWSVLFAASEHTATVCQLAWSPSGVYLAAVQTQSIFLHVYTVATWARTQPVMNPSNRSCVWSPDSSRLYGGGSGIIQYTDVGTWGSTNLRTGFATAVAVDAISRDGAVLAYRNGGASPYVGIIRTTDAALLDLAPLLDTSVRAQCWHHFPRP